MINIINKTDCCGCSACMQTCPKQCISMKEDEEGFLYPIINTENCINCHKCEYVCPLKKNNDSRIPLEVIAAKNKNENERINSSSGGVFILLAKYVLMNNGVVFGAVYDNLWEVHHGCATDLVGVQKMIGSKYMQSRIEETFKTAEFYLKEGREVLFTGTPCQILGLHSFLRKNYDNLLTVDICCHGVPSPGVWRRYLSDMIQKICVPKDKKDNCKKVEEDIGIININFRDKRKTGWKKYSLALNLKKDKKTFFYSETNRDDLYMQGFLKNLYLRPSCYDCKCKDGCSQSDITIGDFWGINKIIPNVDDDKGLSLVLINSEKGRKILHKLNMETWPFNFSIAKQTNRGLSSHIDLPSQRGKFFKLFNQNKTCSLSLIRRFTRVSKIRRLYHFVKSIIRHI